MQSLVTQAVPSWTDPLPAVRRPTLAFVSGGLEFIIPHCKGLNSSPQSDVSTLASRMCGCDLI